MSSRRERRRRNKAVVIGAVVVLLFAGVFTSLALNGTAKEYPVATNDPIEANPIYRNFVPQLLVIGDSYTGGSDMGGYKEAGWPALVQSDYVKSGARLQLNMLGRGGAGYVSPGQIKETLGQSYAGNAFANQDVIVVFAGLNDAGQPAQAVGTAASKLYADLRAKSPRAAMIVVGPAWPNASPVPNVFEVRDAIQASATAVGATFIDPIADAWFTGDAAALIGKDKTHPTDAGHEYMADTLGAPITAALKKAVGDNSQPG